MTVIATTPIMMTYAEFLHPHDHEPGTVDYSVRSVEDRDTNVFPGPPSDAMGVRFFDVVEVVTTDENDIQRVCTSGRFNYSKGIHFYAGTVHARTDIKDHGNTLVPGVANIVLAKAMDDNGWSHVIHCWGLVLPFDAVQDTPP
jgi:hypothetical protein